MKILEYIITLHPKNSWRKTSACRIISPNLKYLVGPEQAIRDVLEKEYGIEFVSDTPYGAEETRSLAARGFSKENHTNYVKNRDKIKNKIIKKILPHFNNMDKDKIRVVCEKFVMWIHITIEKREDINIEALSNSMERKRANLILGKSLIDDEENTCSVIPPADIEKIISS